MISKYCVSSRPSAFGVVERVGEADAVDRVLRDAVDHPRRRDADDLVDRRDDVVARGGTAARGVASGLIFAGQRTAIGLRVPPKCDASSLVPLYGVLPAQAQPAWYMLSVFGEPSTSSPPRSSSASMCCSTVVGMPFCASSSLIVPFWPSAEEPLSPQM